MANVTRALPMLRGTGGLAFVALLLLWLIPTVVVGIDVGTVTATAGAVGGGIGMAVSRFLDWSEQQAMAIIGGITALIMGGAAALVGVGTLVASTVAAAVAAVTGAVAWVVTRFTRLGDRVDERAGAAAGAVSGGAVTLLGGAATAVTGVISGLFASATTAVTAPVLGFVAALPSGSLTTILWGFVLSIISGSPQFAFFVAAAFAFVVSRVLRRQSKAYRASGVSTVVLALIGGSVGGVLMAMLLNVEIIAGFP